MYLRLPIEGARYFDLHFSLVNTSLQPEDEIGLFHFWDGLLIECERLTYAVAAIQYGIETTGGTNGEAHDTRIEFDRGTLYGKPDTIVPHQFTGTFENPDSDQLHSFQVPSLERFQVATESVVGDFHFPFYGWAETGRAIDASSSTHQSPLTDGKSGETFLIEGSINKLCEVHRKVENILCLAYPKNAELFEKSGAAGRKIVADTDWKASPKEKYAESRERLEALDHVVPLGSAWGIPPGCGSLSASTITASIKDLASIDRSDRMLIRLFIERAHRKLADSMLVKRYDENFWKLLKQLRPSERRPDKESRSPPHIEFEDLVYQLTAEIPNLTPLRAWDMFTSGLKEVGFNSFKTFEDTTKRARDRANKRKTRVKRGSK